jgi:predicted phage terminase large subunit-like protein
MGNALLKRAKLALQKIEQLGIGHVEDESIKQERELCESSLYEFCKRAWSYAGNGNQFVEAWHIKALCEHLEEAYKGNISYLVINIPPRCGKSTVLNVIFPAWVWAKEPDLKFMYGSHSELLAHRDSDYCRELIKSSWYQGLWGHKFNLTNDTKGKFNNTHTGFRMALGVGSRQTGFGSHFIVWDDANNIADLDSPTIREGINQIWDLTMSSRWADPNRFVRIISQQRGHIYDVSGHILGKNNPKVVHLCLPLEFEVGRRCKTVVLPSTNGKVWQDPRQKEGELLCPQYITKEKVKELKSDLQSAYAIAGQLQQRPAPEEGGIFKKEWFNWLDMQMVPQIEFILQSWDTAFGNGNENSADSSCYSACTTWGVFKHPETQHPSVVLLNMWQGRVEFPELYKMAQRLYKNYNDVILEDPLNVPGIKPDMVLIESKASGLSLIQVLQRAGVPVIKFDPMKYRAFGSTTNNKRQRARLISAHVENGRVWLPAQPPHFKRLRGYADRFLNACLSFPNDESNDIVDSFSQALLKLISSGWIYHTKDEKPEPELDFSNDRPLY